MVEFVGLGDCIEIEIDAKARPLRHRNGAVLDAEWIVRQMLPILPDPVRINGGDFSHGRSRHVGHHRQRDIEVVVRVRSPCQPVFAAGLRYAYRCAHGPEMRIGQWNVDRMQRYCVFQFAPVGGNHIGCGWQAGCFAKLRHDLASGKAHLRAAGVFSVGKHILFAHAQRDSFLQAPCAVGIKRDACLGKALVQRSDGRDLLRACQHSALELEIVKTILRLRSLGQPHDGIGRHRLFIAQPEPSARPCARLPVAKAGLAAVTYKEEIPEHGHACALPAFAQQHRDRHSQELAKQIEHGRFDGGHRMNGYALIEGLLSAPCRVAIGKSLPDCIKNRIAVGDLLPDDKRRRLFEQAANFFSSGNFSGAYVAGLVGKQKQVAREVRAMRAAEVEQHAVLACYGNDPHGGQARRLAGDVGYDSVHGRYLEMLLQRVETSTHAERPDLHHSTLQTYPCSHTTLRTRQRKPPMNRREFLVSSGAAGLLASTGAAPAGASAAAGDQERMKLGDQTEPTNDTHLKYLARYGVRNICGYPEIAGDRLYATVDELRHMTDMAAKYGISVDCIAPPFLASSYIDREKHPAIMLAESPERDRDIEQLQILIRNCAQAGIPSIKYNMSILGVLRTGRVAGRGDALCHQWKLSAAHPATKLTKAGVVNADAFWERITYFLDRVIPVANEYKIRMACHPQDPGVPPEGYQGVNRVLGTVDGLKKFIVIQESPFHGLNFCQGTISEDLDDPGTQIFDVIRYFGTRKKIFNVHFRNIRGHRDDFVEVFPDEGDVDFVRAIRVYREVGYTYMLMPDHVPVAADNADPNSLQSFAFCYGYIRGLLQSLYEEG